MADHLDIKPVLVEPIPRIALREAEAAEALGVSASWLRREAKKGTLPSVLIKGVRLYIPDELSRRLSELSRLLADSGGETK